MIKSKKNNKWSGLAEYLPFYEALCNGDIYYHTLGEAGVHTNVFACFTFKLMGH